MPNLLYRVRIESRVVPATGVTILRSESSNALVSDDLPTFGRPMMANLGSSSKPSASESSGRAATTASSKSPVPLPLIVEMQYGSPKPSA